MDQNTDELGLTTREALHKLYRDIELVLHQYETSQKSRKRKLWLKDSLHHSSQHTTINWISGLFLLWIILSLIVTYLIEDNNCLLLIEGLFLAFLLILNVSIELYDNKLRYDEVPNRVKAVLSRIKQETDTIHWLPDNYPNLYSPFSPCITLQWTYRDNKLVNLPWSLLVKDDVIVLRPGQVSPGYCEAIDKNTEQTLLHSKEIFSPTLENHNEVFSAPKSRKPSANQKFRLLETPFLNNLKIYLEQALDRPITLINQQRYLLMIRVIERVILPIVLILIFLINTFKYYYLKSIFGQRNLTSLFIIEPNLCILPLLPLIFPIAWNLLNCIGMARFQSILVATKKLETKANSLENDSDNTLVDHSELKYNWKEFWKNFRIVLNGQDGVLFRSANILHVFGTVTALGCVDKKGILSWPNPTAEKVFVLHNNETSGSQSSSLGNLGDLATDLDGSASGTPHHYDSNTATAEVLDLTHNHHDPFKLHFDDHDWDKHLSSLKPLGLAILLNTCNIETQERYTAFCSHITCEAMYNENLIPVTNRRCLCELAKEIGFVDQAQKIFSLEQKLSTFRHLQPEMVRRDNKYARTLQLSTKLKFPFPHMFAVIVKELSTGSIQLLSEGTADIILDSCIDYWDGHDLCPLTVADRKKIQDFYQRSSLTAYCTAFAYRPLNKSMHNQLGEVYLELPSDSRHLYNTNYRSPTPVHWDCNKSVLEPKIKNPIGQFYSTDSLLYNDCPPINDLSDTESCFQMQCNQIFIGMVTMQYQALTDMVQLIEQLENACIRFVHFSKENELRSRVFSEKMGLESGWNCHISLLSERNRRESGQMDLNNKLITRKGNEKRLSQSVRKLTPNIDEKSNLTINSNLESSRTMSFSAPSAINMEHSIVKFDTETTELINNKQSFNITPPSTAYTSIQTTSNDNREQQMCSEVNNIITHDWQSLSCLTDSTEQSAPIHFDMSNRAKLPRGIDKIRPHIELIDNVPLLVSLFTDCTPSAIREMLNIMQDYGEIVCIMGSSANCENASIFMQADASISVEPLYPQVCQKIEVFNQPETNCITPSDLSYQLNSIACSLFFKRDTTVSFYHLLMESRHYISMLWNCVQFWLSCCVILSLMQLLTALFLLPALFTIGQLLWLICFIIPLLSVSLMGLPVEMEVMKKAQGKNLTSLNLNVFTFIVWCYGLKFLPTIFIIITYFAGILISHCNEFCINYNCTCTLFYLPTNYYDGDNFAIDWIDNTWTLELARLLIVFCVLIHFIIISIGFVSRDYLFIKQLPHKNMLWLATVCVLIILQICYILIVYDDMKMQYDKNIQYSLPVWVIISCAISPFIIFIINELVKHQEIRVNKRFQKRARLDFGTKLGMNSPF